jgi:hypothetical protein
VPFDQQAEVEFGEKKRPCRLIDISAKGALIEASEGAMPGVGESIQLTVPLDQGDEVIRMVLSVVRTTPDRIGCRCEEIDLDSITHIRRLLELNLGDAELASRELSELA